MTTQRYATKMGALLALGLTLAGASCDSGGTANNNPDGMVSATAPKLTAVTPDLGPTSGNTMLKITGANFAAGATVQIGATMATNVTVVSATEITATLPAQPTAFGKVPVIVTAADGQKGMSSELFRYYAVTVDFAAGNNIAVGTQPIATEVGDFNGDGKLDVVVANQGSKDLSLLLSAASGPLVPKNAVSTGGAAPLTLAVGDVNGDKKADIAFITNNGTDVSILIGDGTGGFAAPVKYAAGTGTRALLLVDMNGDKNLDAVVVNNTKGVSVLPGMGDGKFGAATATLVGMGAAAIAAGDFNGDGKIDIAFADNVANLGGLLPGSGDGKLGTNLPIGVGATATGIVSGDVNGNYESTYTG